MSDITQSSHHVPMLMVLGWLAIALSASIGLTLLCFGPHGDSENERVKYPLRAAEQAFLKENVADGKEETGFLLRVRSKTRVVRLFYRYWHPKDAADAMASNARGVVVMLTGINTHSGRNGFFARPLLENGFVVAGMDYEGFGRSDGRHGYFESIDHLVDDVVEFIRQTRDKYKGRKVFLHGGYAELATVD